MIKRGGGLGIVKKTPCTKLEWGEVSELLMGFGSDCLTLNSSSRPDCGQQDAATHSVTQQCNRECNTTVQHKSGKQCNTVEQPVDGQVSGPQVFRKSDHLSPCCPRPTPTDQRRDRKLQFSNSFTWSSVIIKGMAEISQKSYCCFLRWSTFCLLQFCLINKVNRLSNFDFLICYLIDKVKMVINLAYYICTQVPLPTAAGTRKGA